MLLVSFSVLGVLLYWAILITYLQMSMSRGKKILLRLKDHSQPDENSISNPDSVLFACNQFPKPYDDLLEHANSAYMPSLPSTAFAFVLENDHPEDININTIDIEDAHNIHTLQLVDNDITEELSLQETDRSSPSLLTSDNHAHNALGENYHEPFKSNDNAQDILSNLNEPHEAILVPSKKLVDYSETDSEPDEPVIKRKKRCQVKKEEWADEINKKNREMGREYKGKKKLMINGIKIYTNQINR